MPLESRQSKRFGKQTPNATALKSTGKLAAKRTEVTMPDQETQIAIPDWAAGFALRNAGAVNLEVRFGDDLETDFWTLEQNDRLPTIPIRSDTIIKVKNLGANAKFECIFYG